MFEKDYNAKRCDLVERGVALLEKVFCWGLAVKIQKPTPGQPLLFLLVCQPACCHAPSLLDENGLGLWNCEQAPN